MVSNDYLKIVSESYDLTDPYTVEKVIMCNEAQKQANIENLTLQLYNQIKNNVDQINFGTIPKSKGNVTKIDGYENLVECINVMASLIKEYGQNTEQIDVVSTGLDNIQKRTRTWEKAFAMNIEFPMMIYNTMVLSIVSSVSLMITTCIEYIKNGNNTVSIAFDKASYIKNKDHVMFVSLRSFNQICRSGELDKANDDFIRKNISKIREQEEYIGYGYLTEEDIDPRATEIFDKAKSIAAPVATILTIYYGLRYALKACRLVTYYFLHLKQDVADYLVVQANFLQTNAENLERKEKYQGRDDERKKVYAKQMKWVERFRSWANFFMVKDKKAQVDAKKKDEEDSKRKPYEDKDDDDGGIF